MSKFKVGDRVKTSENSTSPSQHGLYGKVIKVDESSDTTLPYLCDFEDGRQVWMEEYELVTSRLESNRWYKSSEHKLQAEEIEQVS